MRVNGIPNTSHYYFRFDIRSTLSNANCPDLLTKSLSDFFRHYPQARADKDIGMVLSDHFLEQSMNFGEFMALHKAGLSDAYTFSRAQQLFHDNVYKWFPKHLLRYATAAIVDDLGVVRGLSFHTVEDFNGFMTAEGQNLFHLYNMNTIEIENGYPHPYRATNANNEDAMSMVYALRETFETLENLDGLKSLSLVEKRALGSSTDLLLIHLKSRPELLNKLDHLGLVQMYCTSPVLESMLPMLSPIESLSFDYSLVTPAVYDTLATWPMISRNKMHVFTQP